MLSDESLALRTELWKLDLEIAKRKRTFRRMFWIYAVTALITLALGFIPNDIAHNISTYAYLPYVVLFMWFTQKQATILRRLERRHDVELRLIFIDKI